MIARMMLSKVFESHVKSVAGWTGIGVVLFLLVIFSAMWGHLTSEVPAAKIQKSQEQLSMLAI